MGAGGYDAAAPSCGSRVGQSSLCRGVNVARVARSLRVAGHNGAPWAPRNLCANFSRAWRPWWGHVVLEWLPKKKFTKNSGHTRGCGNPGHDRSKDPLVSQGAFRVPLLHTWGLDEASLDLHCGVPMETCKVASCIVYEAATICLTVLVLVQDRFLDPKLLRASGGSGRPIRARSVFLQMLLLS